jgi:CsoR family transcriptional regulator, copper-sensing transcriptional repressor
MHKDIENMADSQGMLRPSDADLLQRLRRVEGQIKGIQRMIEGGRSCEEIVTQVLAARAALDKVATGIISTHVQDCLVNLPPEEARATVARVIDLMMRLPQTPA